MASPFLLKGKDSHVRKHPRTGILEERMSLCLLS